MKKIHEFPTTIHDLLAHHEFDGFISSKLGNDLYINDPERAERIHEHAESGSDGSTHAEHIEDWRDFAEVLFRALSWEERDEVEKVYDALMADIDACEAWHEKNGSLHEVIG